MREERTLLPRELRDRLVEYLNKGLEKKTQLGVRVANDPALVARILAGREVKPGLERRLLDAMKNPPKKGRRKSNAGVSLGTA